jgi:DNA-binding NarL/FixJ family response regulator
VTVAIGIVEDHPLYLHALAGVVEDADGLELVVTGRTVEQFDRRLADCPTAPAVVLLDLHLDGGTLQGTAAVEHIRARSMAVIVVSSRGDRMAVIDAIDAGAAGYLGKDSEAEDITRAVHTVAGGGMYVSPTLAGYLLHDAARFTLTPREKQILRLLAAGDTDQDIADQLFITANTVHSHLDRIRAKTDRRKRAQLAELAVRLGLVPPS